VVVRDPKGHKAGLPEGTVLKPGDYGYCLEGECTCRGVIDTSKKYCTCE